MSGEKFKNIQSLFTLFFKKLTESGLSLDLTTWNHYNNDFYYIIKKLF